MKSRHELVRDWLRKAESDLAALEVIQQAHVAWDVACFLAQQAAEKYLKAYLLFFEIRFPFTHNLATLVNLAADQDPDMASLEAHAKLLTPYAVEGRYDDDFFGDEPLTSRAHEAAVAIHDAVLRRLPDEYRPSPERRRPE